MVGGAGKRMEPYTNIHRIKHLAKGHPLVAEVDEHNDKSGDPNEFNNVGRAASNHQSPFNLKLTFAAPGATMYVSLGEKWRAAWRQAAKAPPTRRAAAAASSSSPATRHPASGGKGPSSPQPLAPRWISTSPPSLLWSLPDSKGPWGSSKRSFPDPNDPWVPSKERRR